MRYTIIAAVLLAGCAQTMTLYPRGGGTQATGELRTAEKTMTVTIDGEPYSGDFIGGRSTAFGASTGLVGTKPVTMTGTSTAHSNAYSAILLSKSGKTLRCEFAGGLMESGNGVCQHGDGRVFDLLLKP